MGKAVFYIWLMAVCVVWGDDALEVQVVEEEHFAALTTLSPFRRSLNLSKTLNLTGVAKIGDARFVTLYNYETRETHTVSSAANAEGWRMISIKGDQNDLESLTAQISLAQGEVFVVRHDKNLPKPSQRKPEYRGRGGSRNSPENVARAASNYRAGFGADGFPDKPPPEIVAKLSKLSQKQREGIVRHFNDLKSKGVGMEERRKLYVKMVDRTLKGGSR